MRRFGIIALAATVFAVLVGPDGPLGRFWAPDPDAPAAHGAVLAGLIGETMVENVAFGVGIAVLLLGRRWFAARTDTARAGHIARAATAWLLASWLPHAALHRHLGMQPSGILPVEWIFHAGSIIATVLLLWAFAHTVAAPARRSRPADNSTVQQPR